MSQNTSGQSTPKNKGNSLQSQSSYALKGSSPKYRTKKKKVVQLTMVKRGQFRVIDNSGMDRTPKLLYDSDYQVIEEWQPTVLDYVDADMGSSGSQISLARTLQQTSVLSYGSRQPHSVSLQMSFTNIANVDSYKEPTLKTLEGDAASDTRSEERFSEIAPSQFRLKDLPSREFFPPHSKVPIIAKETDSFTLFSLGSVVLSATADEADALRRDNELYESFTFGEGRYKRKLNSSEQQTTDCIRTSQSCYCPRKPTKNGSTWVTIWKIFDEYAGVLDTKKDSQMIPVEEQWAQVAEDERFITQCLIMERILGSPTFRGLQLNYKQALQLDPMDIDIQFSYSAKSLWMYETILTMKKPAVAIAINSFFPDIIAVGYGKFLHIETDRGFICVWCAKNLKHPERFFKLYLHIINLLLQCAIHEYKKRKVLDETHWNRKVYFTRFTSSVMCLDFATRAPNLLAAGFMNGDLLILDISTAEKKVAYSKNSNLCNSYERILFTKWCVFTDIFDKEEERLMITTGDGRVMQLRRRLDKLVPFQMMRITKAEGKVKGIECLRRCEAEEITMVRFPAAHCIVYYPNDSQFYLVSGNDGIIHKCSVNYFTQHLESFLAHSGPVYALKFSPFCGKIFFSCGADGAVRLWVWDIFEPVITLTIGANPVEDAAWSPRNSTVIASISDCNLYLWDLRRKTYYPASTIVHPCQVKFCTLKFTENGNNIILGDMEGSVYVMSLYGMPFEERFKEDILAACIEKELVVKPKLLKLVKKSGPPFTP